MFPVKLVMAVVLVLSAVLQYNDPDPWPWMALYGAAALLTVLSLWPRPLRFWYLILALLALVWAASLFPGALDTNMEASLEAVFGSTAMKNERVEIIREVGGLLIVAVWMVVLARMDRERGVP